MYKRTKAFFSKNATAWQFAKYTMFSMGGGIVEVVLFMILNYYLPKNGINQPVSWFIFVYPSIAGGLGALIAFVVSSVVGQALKFITNFKTTFKSTNNIFLSAIGFAVMAIIIVVGLNLYVGGILNTALCKVIPNADIAGAIAKITCQISGFLLIFPVNKFILMRNKTDKADMDKV